MNKFYTFLLSLGLKKNPNSNEDTQSQAISYISVIESKSQVHMEYLRGLEDNENKRLDLLESKTAQLVSQTGIIFSLLGLFVPFLVDKISEVSIAIKISLLVLLLVSFTLYVLTIINALKNFHITKYNYSSPSPQNVLLFQDKELHEFYSEVVNDLLYCIGKNTEINNIKATNLLHSYNSFKLGNIFMAFLVIVFCFSILFLKPSQQTLILDGHIKIEGLDSITAEINKSKINKKDTLVMPIKIQLK